MGSLRDSKEYKKLTYNMSKSTKILPSMDSFTKSGKFDGAPCSKYSSIKVRYQVLYGTHLKYYITDSRKEC